MTNEIDPIPALSDPGEAIKAYDELAHAFAFIIDSLNDDHFLSDIEQLDYESMMEFAEQWGFTETALRRAIDRFRKAAFREVTGTR